MDSGRPGLRPRFPFDSSDPALFDSADGAAELAALADGRGELTEAIGRTRDWLLSEQHSDGHWCAELEGDSILESEYLLLLAWLGREKNDLAAGLGNELLARQEPTGGWSMYPGGPTDVSGSVKAYLALRLVGHKASSPALRKAREAILAAGGAERVNSFTRYYLALLGIVGYHQVPAVPPELMLVPTWCPLNVYEMSAWSRTIVVPLSLLWAFKPRRDLPAEGLTIDELFLRSPAELPVAMDKAAFTEEAQVVGRRGLFRLNWHRFFCGVDRAYKLAENVGLLRPARRRAVAKAEAWMTARFADSDGLGAIFPPIIWAVVALKCLGHGDDSPLVRGQLRELERLCLAGDGGSGETGDGEIASANLSPASPDPPPHRIRVQPCKSPVWDTAITTLALREAGLPAGHPAIRDACSWLLDKEVRVKGDWAVRKPGVEPSGWFFEYENRFYPDVDDTVMVLMALVRSLPATIETPWAAEFLLDQGQGTRGQGQKENGAGPWTLDSRPSVAVLTARTDDAGAACDDLAELSPMLTSIWRGVKWTLAMQGRDGGWGAFDSDNTRWIFTQVPFADHNAMIDPSTSDLTARVLELFGQLRAPMTHPAVRTALARVWKDQETDGSWYGRWGVNYLYGTWQALLGLGAIGVPKDDPRIRRAVGWLKSVQQPCGGWGESLASYDDPAQRGRGNPTASQTAWGLMGLVAAGDAKSESARRAADRLIETQNADGTWDEPEMTGTGFPQVFYLRYHYYRIYFPLMALARYERATRGGW